MTYYRKEVDSLVHEYARFASFSALTSFDADYVTKRGVSAWLMDIDDALARLAPAHFEALTLQGLKQLKPAEAAQQTGRNEKTMRRRYQMGLDLLVRYMNEPGDAPKPIRDPGWREWALGEEGVSLAQTRRPGAPVTTSPDVEERIVILACAGETQRAIAAIEGVPRSTVRSVVARYGVPQRTLRSARSVRGHHSDPNAHVANIDPQALIRAYMASKPKPGN